MKTTTIVKTVIRYTLVAACLVASAKGLHEQAIEGLLLVLVVDKL